MTTINNTHLIQLAGAVDDAVTDAYAVAIAFDIRNYKGYDWGASGRTCSALLRIEQTGLSNGSGGASSNDHDGVTVIKVKRDNGGFPSWSTVSGTSFGSSVSIDWDGSGYILQIRTFVYAGAPGKHAVLITARGHIVDWT